MPLTEKDYWDLVESTLRAWKPSPIVQFQERLNRDRAAARAVNESLGRRG